MLIMHNNLFKKCCNYVQHKRQRKTRMLKTKARFFLKKNSRLRDPFQLEIILEECIFPWSNGCYWT